MDKWLKTVAKNLTELKKQKGWSQDVLAEKAGCSKSVIRDLEAKKAGASVAMLLKISSALDVTLSELIGDEKVEVESKHEPVSIFAKKLLNIPDEIYDLAQKVGPDDKQAWDAVKSAMNWALGQRAKERGEASS